MTRLSISLLGKPQISLDGSLISIPTARAVPILAYLAITGTSQSREKLADLLWGESGQGHALAALRTTLWRLKSAGLEDWIILDRNEISLNYQQTIDVDVLSFTSLLNKCNTHGHPPSQICLYCTPAITEAIGLYHGEFMAGFNITNALNFDDWRMQQSEALQVLHLDGLERLVKCHRTFGDLNRAIHYARMWLDYDRLNENAYYQLIQLYSITGQRTAGISLFKRYKEILRRDLGVEPSDELITLYRQLQTGQSTSQNNQKVKNPVFLIAEMENPVQYWTTCGNKKNETLAALLNIFRDVAHRFGGRILQKSDDSTTLLFENGQPLHCAVAIHQKLRNTDWGDVGPPNIRMVVYSTFIESDKSSSFASITSTASSLLSISWGGQVVFSEQTIKLLDMPSGSDIKDLGFHFLDNIEGPIHVYELIHPNLPQREHPPLTSRILPLVNFPILTPAFVGREQELVELVRLITASEARLISLVGPGGIGKTSLAVHFASSITKYFPDGVFFISLASIQDADYIPILLAEVLKFSFYGSTNHAEQLGRYLHRMKVLLVIDNFEHMRGEGTKVLATILSQTHFLKIIVATRERLNMVAETILEVHGLPVPMDTTDENAQEYSSVKLFVQNAKKTLPKFPPQDNLEAIIRICQIVDGIPLAILLASSWVRVFSCVEIASEIKKNYNFLSTSAIDVDYRHSSLRAVFDQSWALLSSEERKILQRLSVFKSEFSIQAAHQICDAAPLSLSSLADKSLLTRQVDHRYEMLATFNQYVAEKLENDSLEKKNTIEKFCDYYANYCAQKHKLFMTSQQQSALDEMTLEIENIRTAWNLLVETDRWDVINQVKEALLAYHVMLGNAIQGRELYRLVLVKLNKLNDPGLELFTSSMLQLFSWMTIKNGFISEGLEGLSESLVIFRRYNSAWEIAMTLMFVAEASRSLGHRQQAMENIEEAIQILCSNAVPETNYSIAITAHCRSLYGILLMDLGEYDQAYDNMSESLATHNRIGTYYGTIHPLMALGRLAYIRGDFNKSLDLFLQAMETANKIYDRRGMALIYNNLASVYEVTANISESYHCLTLAMQYCSETGDRRLNAIIINNLAFHQMMHLHQPAEAIRTYHECLEVFHEIGDLRGLTYTCYDISRAYLMVGLVDEAWSYCLRSLHTALTLDSTPLVLHTMHGFVNLFTWQQEHEKALRLCYLIVNHPAVEMDTRKRAIVSKVELEAIMPAEKVHASKNWSETANLQGVVDQILAEGSSLHS
jgi:predicted ATPase/DNA-binding SARP family transcriptional activator